MKVLPPRKSTRPAPKSATFGRVVDQANHHRCPGDARMTLKPKGHYTVRRAHTEGGGDAILKKVTAYKAESSVKGSLHRLEIDKNLARDLSRKVPEDPEPCPIFASLSGFRRTWLANSRVPRLEQRGLGSL